jgi:hypothetical protein
MSRSFFPFRRTAAHIVLAGLLLLPGTPALAFDEPPGFHGIPWGASKIVVQQQFPRFTCYPTLDHCSGTVALGPVLMEVFFQFGPEGMDSVSATFAASKYAMALEAFLARYGPPTARWTTPVQTLGGPSFTNETLYWAGATTNIVLERYGRKITEAVAYLSTKAGDARLLAKNRKSTDTLKRALD